MDLFENCDRLNTWIGQESYFRYAREKAYTLPLDMKTSSVSGSILKAAILAACIYGIVKFELLSPPSDDTIEFAESACITEIGNRYETSQIRPYSVTENSSGYTVRASITLAKGSTAKVYCLTNTHGGVKEITIEQR